MRVEREEKSAESSHRRLTRTSSEEIEDLIGNFNIDNLRGELPTFEDELSTGFISDLENTSVDPIIYYDTKSVTPEPTSITPSKTREIESEMGKDTMPVRNARGAPNFDPADRNELPRYFEDLEDWFKKAEITKDEEKRPYVIKYVPMQTAEEWKNLTGFDTKKYEEIKKMILREYPEVMSIQTGSLARLKKLCKENRRISEDDLQVLLDFKRAFMAEAAKLTKAPTLLANHTLVTYFVDCLTPNFRDRLFAKLDIEQSTMAAIDKLLEARNIEVLKPVEEDHTRNEDMYPLDKVADRAEHMARHRNPGTTLSLSKDIAIEPVAVKIESREHVGNLHAELEDVKGTLAAMRDTMAISEKIQRQNKESSRRDMEDMLRKAMNSNSGAVAPAQAGHMDGGNMYGQTRPRQYQPYQQYQPYNQESIECRYCKRLGHVVAVCDIRASDLASSCIRISDQGRILMPDGTQVPYEPNKSLKERVEEWHKRNPKQGTQGYQAQPYYSQNYMAPQMGPYPQFAQTQGGSLDEQLEEEISQKQAEIDRAREVLMRNAPQPQSQTSQEEIIRGYEQRIATLTAEREQGF